MSDTIFAPATAPGRAAIAVVRVSGPGTVAVVRRLAGRVPKPRRASVRTLRSPDGSADIDQALVIFFAAPASYTGEDLAEFHVHGGPAVVGGLLSALQGLGVRLAEPGEFTRRAFQNGRMDLAQAEGVADLVDAETDAQREQALAQLGGRLSRVEAEWKARLIQALALLEAAVDFADEELPADVAQRAAPVLNGLLTEIEAAAAGALRGERVREGFRVALIGAPNAGKSTLLNALAGRDAAIVTATPGTTRDIIEVPLVLAGYKVLLADTAGLREAGDEIEAEGIRRARAWATSADLRLWLVDGSVVSVDAPEELRQADLCLVTKRDLQPGAAGAQAADIARRTGMGLNEITSRSPSDIAWVLSTLTDRVVERLGQGDAPVATRLRHQAVLATAATHLRSALGQVEEVELAAEDVRLAARALERLTGRVDTEAVLGRIFSTFCIGK